MLQAVHFRPCFRSGVDSTRCTEGIFIPKSPLALSEAHEGKPVSLEISPNGASHWIFCCFFLIIGANHPV